LAANPWLALPKQIILRYLPPPGDNAQTCGPGPFSVVAGSVKKQQIESAGYTDIEFERIDARVMVGD